MTSYAPSIIKCPQCGGRTVLNNMMSAYVRWGERAQWLDGTVNGSPQSKAVIKCRQCLHVYFEGDAQTIMPVDIRNRHLDPSRLDGVRPIDPDFDDFVTLANQPNLDRNREIYIRKIIWNMWNNFLEKVGRHKRSIEILKRYGEKVGNGFRVSNDTYEPRRTGPLAPETGKADADANAARLLQLFDTEDLDQRLLKAELLRELGRFGEALALLDGVSEARVEGVVRLQRELCAHRDQHVHTMRFRESHR